MSLGHLSSSEIWFSPLGDLWKYVFWTRVDMSHWAHDPIGFDFIEYCTKQFGKKNWALGDTDFYFRYKNDATTFALRWM